MIGARIAQAIISKTLPRSSPSRRKPPNIAPHWIAWPSEEMRPAIAAAMVAMRMSRFFTCESSCAMTPSSCRGVRICMIPLVTATAAWPGLRPVAKAFGVIDGMTYSFGIGMPALRVSRSTIS